MERYQFEKIYTQMEKEYGKIRKGQEEAHSMLLFALEGNALKTYRENKGSNSRRLREAIALALYDIKSRCDGAEYNTGAFRDEDNSRLEKALLMAFDPFTNEEIQEIIGQAAEPEQLQEYYKEPVMCLLRIKESIDIWEKQAGSNGYFNFLEGYMGHMIKGDKMTYAILEQSDKL